MPRLFRLKKLLFILACLPFCLSVYSTPLVKQSESYRQLDSLLTTMGKQKLFVGDLYIDGNNNNFLSKFYADDKILATGQSLSQKRYYEIGSLNELFVMVLILKLDEKKVLSLQDKVSDFIKDVNNIEGLTIEDLLTHNTKIYNVLNDPTVDVSTYENLSVEQLINLFSKKQIKKAEYIDNRHSSYNDFNYILLESIIEKVTQKKYFTVLKKEILDPFSLTEVLYLPAKSQSVSITAFYQYKDSEWEQDFSYDKYYFGVAKDIAITPYNLCLFVENLFNPLFFSKQNLGRLVELGEKSGYGFSATHHRGAVYYSFAGGGGSNEILSYFPSEKTSVALFFNGVNFSPDVIEEQVYEAVLGRSVDFNILPTDYTPTNILSPTVYEGVFVDKESGQFTLTIRVKDNKMECQFYEDKPIPLLQTSKMGFSSSYWGVDLHFRDEVKNQYQTLFLKIMGLEYVLKRKNNAKKIDKDAVKRNK